FCGRMIGALPAKRGSLPLANAGGGPHAPLLIHGKAMDGSLAVPDRFVTPVGRRSGGSLIAGAWSIGVTRLEFDLTRGVGLRVDHGEVVRALFESAVDRTVRVHCGVSLVAGNLVVKILSP